MTATRARVTIPPISSPAKDLGPVAHMLVGGEDDRAILVARVHEAEEEVGLLAVEGPKAHLVDDEERAVQVALAMSFRGLAAPSPLSTCMRSSRRKWVTLNPFLMAFAPSATARWLSPTPGGPLKSTWSASRTKAHVGKVSSVSGLQERDPEIPEPEETKQEEREHRSLER